MTLNTAVMQTAASDNAPYAVASPDKQSSFNFDDIRFAHYKIVQSHRRQPRATFDFEIAKFAHPAKGEDRLIGNGIVRYINNSQVSSSGELFYVGIAQIHAGDSKF